MTASSQSGRVHPLFAFILGVGVVILLLVMTRGCFHTLSHTSWNGLGPSWLFPGGGWGMFGRFTGLISIWGLINLALAIWVGVDASRKELTGGPLWGLLVFFTGIIGLLVYLLVAPTMVQRNGASAAPPPAAPASPAAAAPAAGGAQARCDRCQSVLQPEFKACPYCGAARRCPHCDQPVQASWKVCPYCTASLGGDDRSA